MTYESTDNVTYMDFNFYLALKEQFLTTSDEFTYTNYDLKVLSN